MPDLKVKLTDASYDIQILPSSLSKILDITCKLLSPDKVIIITDQNVARIYLDKFNQGDHKTNFVVVVPPGENSKSFSTYQNVCEDILSMEITRKTVLVALGGGVVGDLTGFIASTLLRGVRFVQVPTTLLAQVDSSVGGKTAINSAHGKNLVGSFFQPAYVAIDPDTIATLSPALFMEGYAEILKCALINDASFFTWLDDNKMPLFAQDRNLLVDAIARSCQIKANFVQNDERELGARALLNFGHTFGHAIELLSQYGISHGAAVSIGMKMATQFSLFKGMITKKEYDSIVEHMKSLNMPLESTFEIQRLLPLMKKDKKASAGGKITLILLEGIGNATIVKDVTHEDLLTCFS